MNASQITKKVLILTAVADAQYQTFRKEDDKKRGKNKAVSEELRQIWIKTLNKIDALKVKAVYLSLPEGICTDDFNTFVNGYEECAAWLGSKEGKEELKEADLRGEKWHARSHNKNVIFCGRLIKEMAPLYIEAEKSYDWNGLGCDAYLDTAGHGTGIEDRKEVPEELSKKIAAGCRENYHSITAVLYRGKIIGE